MRLGFLSLPLRTMTPAEQCTHEIKVVLHRWEDESDLDTSEILECLNAALKDYYDEDIVEFESDIDLDE